MVFIIRIYPEKGKITDEYYGDSVLNPFTAIVHEEKNGEYSLTMTIDRLDTVCENGKILIAPTPKHGNQKFRIVKTYPAITDEKTVYARHIFYDLEDNYIDDIRPTETTGELAVEKLFSALLYSQGITGSSDIQRTATAYWEMLNPVEALIGTQENSFINRWGGVIDRNNKNFCITDESLEPLNVIYGINLAECGLELDMTSVVTSIIPTGLQADGTSVLKLPELYVDSPHIGDYFQPKVKRIHYSNIRIGENEGEFATEEAAFVALRAAAAAEFESGIDLPAASGTVSIVDLQKMLEYKNVKGLQPIIPFSPVRVWLNNATYISAEMQAYDYDALSEQFESITIGMPQQFVGKSLFEKLETLGERVGKIEQRLTTGG